MDWRLGWWRPECPSGLSQVLLSGLEKSAGVPKGFLQSPALTDLPSARPAINVSHMHTQRRALREAANFLGSLLTFTGPPPRGLRAGSGLRGAVQALGALPGVFVDLRVVVKLRSPHGG